MARLNLSRVLTPREVKRVRSRLPRNIRTVFKIDKQDKGDPTGFILIHGNKKNAVHAVINEIKQLGGVDWS